MCVYIGHFDSVLKDIFKKVVDFDELRIKRIFFRKFKITTLFDEHPRVVDDADFSKFRRMCEDLTGDKMLMEDDISRELANDENEKGRKKGWRALNYVVSKFRTIFTAYIDANLKVHNKITYFSDYVDIEKFLRRDPDMSMNEWEDPSETIINDGSEIVDEPVSDTFDARTEDKDISLMNAATRYQAMRDKGKSKLLKKVGDTYCDPDSNMLYVIEESEEERKKRERDEEISRLRKRSRMGMLSEQEARRLDVLLKLKRIIEGESELLKKVGDTYYNPDSNVLYYTEGGSGGYLLNSWMFKVMMYILLVVAVVVLVIYFLNRKNKKVVCSRYEVGGDCVE